MTLTNFAGWVVLPALVASAALACVRVLRGPSLPDRVVALDLLGTIGIALVAAVAVVERQPAYLDVAIALGLTGFLGTVAFARYIERGTR